MRKVLPILTLVLFAIALFLPMSSPQPVEGQTATEALTTDMDAKTDDLFNGRREGHTDRRMRQRAGATHRAREWQGSRTTNLFSRNARRSKMVLDQLITM